MVTSRPTDILSKAIQVGLINGFQRNFIQGMLWFEICEIFCNMTKFIKPQLSNNLRLVHVTPPLMKEGKFRLRFHIFRARSSH